MASNGTAPPVMDAEDYFGDVSIPDNEIDEDATNDVTFGDLGDIKAGDDVSETLWKPNHQTFSSTIQTERESFLRQHLKPSLSPSFSPSASPSPPAQRTFCAQSPTLDGGPDARLEAWAHMLGVNASPQSSTAPQSVSELQSHPQSQTQVLTHLGKTLQSQELNHVSEQPRSISSAPIQRPIPQPLKAGQSSLANVDHTRSFEGPAEPGFSAAMLLQERLARLKAQSSTQTHSANQNPQHLREHQYEQPMSPPANGYQRYSNSPSSLDEYEHRALRILEQQAREAIASHHETARKQLHEALVAQRAGVHFDRAEFDRHQSAALQLIMTEYYTRVRQVQLAVWQRKQHILQAQKHQQQQQQLELQQPDQLQLEDSPKQLQVSPSLQSQPQLQHSQTENEQSEQQDDKMPSLQSVVKYLSAFENSDQLNSSSAQGHKRAIVGLNFSSSSMHTNGVLSSPMNVSQNSSVLPEERRSRPYMQNESNSRKLNNEDILNDPRMQEIERRMAEAGLGPSNSRLSGNNNRQSAFALFRKEEQRPALKKSDRRLESMTDRDQELVFRVHLRQLESTTVYKDDYYCAVVSKERKQSDSDAFGSLSQMVQTIRLSAHDHGHDGISRSSKKSRRAGTSRVPQSSSPTNNEQGSRAFANALGSVQSWNPRAPKRTMGHSNSEGLSPGPDNDSTPEPVWSDIRVQASCAIEDGYDIIAKIHDICRGENKESLEDQIRQLIETLHLQEVHDVVVLHERELWHSTPFFETICASAKGRHYLEHVLDLLDLSEMSRIMPALFSNLGKMLYRTRTQQDCSNRILLSKRMRSILCDAELSSIDCLAVFHAFITAHSSDEQPLICSLRSAVGARLVFTCIQRILRGLATAEFLDEELNQPQITKFALGVAEIAPKCFKNAESVQFVWEVIGSMDGLLSTQSQKEYRDKLSELVQSNKIPAPPGT